jgi:hypothetical protein
VLEIAHLYLLTLPPFSPLPRESEIREDYNLMERPMNSDRRRRAAIAPDMTTLDMEPDSAEHHEGLRQGGVS